MADTQIISRGPGATDLARQILSHNAPQYTFSFTPFLRTTYRHGIPPTAPVCKAFIQGHCPMGNACPDRHTNPAVGSNYNNLVCKHWLRALCKKGDSCEFLHEFNLRKMPECSFFVRNGYCSNGDECLYLHPDPSSRLPPCPHYDRGFCPLGPICAKKHIRKQICPFYLAGFCPDGPKCGKAHPRFPDKSKMEKPTIRVIKTEEEKEEEQRILRENAEREEERERERWGGGEESFGGRGRGGWRGRGGFRGRGEQRRQRGRGHY